MEYSEIMIRYGELSTKGRNRKFFIKKLRDQVKKALRDMEGPEVEYSHDRMYIYLNGADGDEVIERVRHIFGIQSLSPVHAVEKDFDAIKAAAVRLVEQEYQPGQTFKISTRRSDHDFAYDTMEINREAGAAVIEALPGIQAQMKKPDITCQIEIRDDAAYLMTRKVEGPGGLPVGSSGRGMLMLSGGIDSPVAGYLAQRKGLDIEAVHFQSPPYTSPQALQKAKDLTAKLARYNGSVYFISVPFTEIQETIKNEVPDEYSMTLNRRFMLRITDEIRKQRSGLAILNGESVGQVASQTLESMYCINAVTTTPVIRPVATMTKDEIIEIAKEIDTYELAIQPYEDCCTVFAPVKPKTKPKMDKVLEYEEGLDVEGLIERALAGIEIEEITAEAASSVQEEKLFQDLL